MGIGAFSMLGGLGRLAIPGVSQFVFVVAFVSAIFIGGWWLRWDARADVTRAVVERVASGIRKENEELVEKVQGRNQKLERAVAVARQQVEESQAQEGQLMIQLAEYQEKLRKQEERIAQLIKGSGDKGLHCGLSREMLRGVTR